MHADGRERALDVLEGEKIGGGGDGDIYRVRISLPMETGAVEHICILKNFEIAGRSRTAAFEDAKHALSMWEQLRQVGVRTWPTYRLEKNSPTVLMSDGEPFGSLLISDNSSLSRDKINHLPPLEVENFTAAIDRAIADAKKAGEKGIYLYSDAWLCRCAVNNGRLSIDIFAGDFNESSSDDDPCVDLNLDLLKEAVGGYLKDFTRTDKDFHAYLKLFEEKASEARIGD